jgi:RNA-dependent RNA polymerase
MTTWELWRMFEHECAVAFIELFENRQGNREGTAKIRFSPPPHRAFWTEEYVTIQRTEDEESIKVKVELEPQKRLFRIQSPIWKDVSYPETMHLYPSTVGFGVMHDEFTMMNMYNAQALPQTSPQTVSRAGTSFKVDLLRGRITVFFQVKLTDPQYVILSEAARQAHIGPLDRINKYMFTIPLAQLRKIYRTENGKKQWSLIISLESPPAFFRKRLDPKASHATKSLVWSEFDTWFRQTDIVYDPRQLETAEVALRKNLAVIDIGDSGFNYLN